MTAAVRILAESSVDAAAVVDRIGQAVTVVDTSRDYPNRRGGGVRRYLTVRVPDNDEQEGDE